jgi:CDP-diacylglycerol--glycerol-3-phosphate 3-phosphatidyltransferase
MVCGQREGLQQLGIYLLLGIAAASELSDVLDGQFARRLQQVSHFGKLMDPYADSTFRMTVFFCFASHVYGRWVPLWMVVILLYRDITTSVVRTFGLGKRKVISARISGKIKGFVQGTVIITALSCAAIWGYRAPEENANVILAVNLLMCLNVLVAVGSGLDYVWANRHLFREEQPS